MCNTSRAHFALQFEHATTPALQRKRLGLVGSDYGHVRALLLSNVGGLNVFNFVHTSWEPKTQASSVSLRPLDLQSQSASAVTGYTD